MSACGPIPNPSSGLASFVASTRQHLAAIYLDLDISFCRINSPTSAAWSTAGVVESEADQGTQGTVVTMLCCRCTWQALGGATGGVSRVVVCCCFVGRR